MATKAQKVRLSIFLILSSTVLLAFFVVLVGNRMMQRMDNYYVVYKDISVTGLEPGSAVKYHGVQVGRVVQLAVTDAASIEIGIEIERGIPIKQDTKAIMTLAGITGQKFIELIGGSVEAERLPVGGSIIAGQSMFDSISGRAELLFIKLDEVIDNFNNMINPEMTESLHRAIVSFGNVSVQVDNLLADNSENFTQSMYKLDAIMTSLSETAEYVNESMSAVNTLVKSDETKQTLTNINHITTRLQTQLDSLRMAETMQEFHSLMENSNNMVVHYDLLVMQARDDILRSFSNLEEALENIREVTDVIRDNPSVLLRGRQTSGDRIE